MAQRPVVVVTGGAGFIGSHLVRRLVQEEWGVHVLARPSSPTGRLHLESDRLTLHICDVTDGRAVRSAMAQVRPTTVFHLANRTDLRRATEPGATIESVEVGLLGTLQVVAAAEESLVDRIVRVGGLEEYGDGTSPADENQREQPTSPYSASQVAATHYCQMLQRFSSCSIVTLRPALVYGPDQSADFLIPSLIGACLRGQDFVMTAGDPWRDLLYVDDLVDALLKAATAPAVAGEVINVGSGREYRIADVASLIMRETGADIRLTTASSRQRPEELTRLSGQISRAAELLGWEPTIPLEEGIRNTIAWYRQEHSSAANPESQT